MENHVPPAVADVSPRTMDQLLLLMCYLLLCADVALVVTPVKEPASPLQLPQLPAADLDDAARLIYVDESIQHEVLNFDYVGLKHTGDDEDDVMLFRHQAHW